jgi:hypothetical protein
MVVPILGSTEDLRALLQWVLQLILQWEKLNSGVSTGTTREKDTTRDAGKHREPESCRYWMCRCFKDVLLLLVPCEIEPAPVDEVTVCYQL